MKYYQSSIKKKPRRSFKGMMVVVLLIVFFLVLYNIFNISTIILKSVDDRGDDLVSRYRLDLINEISKNNIFLFNDENLIVRKDGRDIKFNIDNIEKTYPSTVFVSVSIPESSLVLKMNDLCFDVSDDGLVLSKSGNPCLVKVEDSLSVGDFIDRPKISTINLLLSDSMLSSLTNISVGSEDLFITDAEGISYILPIAEDINVVAGKLMLLKKIRQQYTIDSKKLEEVDLRYSKPVVKFR